jgi:hypothetical protein
MLNLKIFIPSLSLAFEYQGETHYFSTHTYGSAHTRQKKDEIKKNFAKKLGITLIDIPFWWNKSANSLAATIHYRRMDLLDKPKEGVLRIPEKMPYRLQNRIAWKRNIAQEYSETIDPTTWFVK